jgi:multidrug resistance efflux pump
MTEKSVSEGKTGQAVTAQAETASAPPVSPAKKKKKKKKIKRIVILTVLVLILAAGGFGLWRLLFHEEEQQILADPVSRGSITSMVEGSGVARAKESASITLTDGGKVLDVYVSEGDFVHKGDPLYRIDSTDAEAALTAAQKTLSNYEKELNALYDAYSDLTVTASYAGKLLDVKKFSVGDDVSVGAPIATLVDDAKMRLTQYFSYAYEDSIAVGQTVQVSVPAAMAILPGKVEEVNKV